mgnify:CR=1 FL=1
MIRSPGLSLVSFAALLGCLSSPASAQQFVEETGRLPSQSFYSNQLSACDFDLDGDMDFVVADGQGYTSQGSALQVRLYVNDGTGQFTDESSARAAGVTGWFRGVEFGDCDGDGDPDMILAQDYFTAPVLLINDGNGFFTDESATRLPAQRLSSARAQFADVDQDGDLDLAFCDSGTSSRFGSNGRTRLLINDGNGFYQDDTDARMIGGSTMSQQMDLLFFDADNDLDLDMYVGTRSSGSANSSRLWTNDGKGFFTSSLTAGGDYSVYSYDAGDIDGDARLDLIGANGASGNREKLIKNNAPGSWSDVTTWISPNPGADDNDSKFLDFDDDGDLDLVIAVLYGSRERMYVNDGTGQFTEDTSLISGVSDATLDIAVADFTGDGRADIITVQGEGGSFQNRFYRNTGAFDTRAPVIAVAGISEADESGRRGVLARITDSYTSDRGFDPGFVRAEIRRAGEKVQSLDMVWVGNSIWRADVIAPECSQAFEYRIICSDRSDNIRTGEWLQADLGGSALAGDLNSDGCVDGMDVAVVLGFWGSTTQPCFDLNGNGAVDGGDLSVVLGSFGKCL